MTNNGNGKPDPNIGTARQGGKGLPPRDLPHPENTCFGCLAVGLAVFLALVIAGYVFWRFNPEFHAETAGPTIHVTPTPTPVKR